jgi:chromosome segregation ATPase
VLAKLNQTKQELDSAKAEIRSTKNLILEIQAGLKERILAWSQLRASISIRAANNFTMLMRTRGFNAKLILDHCKGSLDLKVDVHADGAKHGGAAGEKDPKTLSGGEKSFSTVCLLLSLWESMGNPFRALDEYDVFMVSLYEQLGPSSCHLRYLILLQFSCRMRLTVK